MNIVLSKALLQAILTASSWCIVLSVSDSIPNRPASVETIIQSSDKASPHRRSDTCTDDESWSTLDTTTGIGLWSDIKCSKINENPNHWCSYLLVHGRDGKTTKDACCSCKGQSAAATQSPSDMPSSAPTQCIDESSWSILNNSITCSDITTGFCDLLAQFWDGDKNASLACCVCGGGKHVPIPDSDRPSAAPSVPPRPSTSPSTEATLEPSKVKSNNPSLLPTSTPSTEHHEICTDEPGWKINNPNGHWTGTTCKMIADDPSFWCDHLRELTSADGLAASQACCVCQGGTVTKEERTSQPSASPSAMPSTCEDQPDWLWETTLNYGCDKLTPSFCGSVSSMWYEGKNAELACCVCGGGFHVPFVPSTVPSSAPSISHQPTATSVPTATPSLLPSLLPTLAPSAVPSLAPSTVPSLKPSTVPSSSPTSLPTSIPSLQPSSKPSLVPTYMPSLLPSIFPTLSPTSPPSLECFDHPLNWHDSDGSKFNCLWYADKQNCYHYGDSYANLAKTANTACCVCGGGIRNNAPSSVPSGGPSSTTVPSGLPSSSPSSRPSSTPTIMSSTNPTTTPSSTPSSEPSIGHSVEPSTNPSESPLSIPTATTATLPTVSIGWYHVCGIDTHHTLFCWGRNQYGEVGIGSNEQTTITSPTAIEVENDPKELGLGGYHSCMLDVLSKVFCWGWNGYGQLGLSNNEDRSVPTEVISVRGAIKVSAGGYHTCIITALKKVWCWGRNNYGQLGTGSTSNSNKPVEVVGLSNISSVSLSYGHSCAVDSFFQLYCWGWNNVGQLGLGHKTNKYTPTKVVFDNGQVVQVWCFGYNGYGQLGDGTTTKRTTPTQTSLATAASQIGLGEHHSCAVDDLSDLWCWGQNNYGQLGLGTNSHKNVPTKVTAVHDVVQVRTGGYSTILVDGDGNIMSMGYNYYGQLGLGDTTHRNIPTLLTGI